MVGIFSRFSAGRSSHRRTKSATESRESTLDPTMEVGGSSTGNAHEIDADVEFKPIEHPTEPFNYDQPVRCPVPDPSILNDGRLWKERISTSHSAGTSAKTAFPVVNQASHVESDVSEAGGIAIMPHPVSPKHVLLGSIINAPEHHLLTITEPCNAAENQAAQS